MKIINYYFFILYAYLKSISQSNITACLIQKNHPSLNIILIFIDIINGDLILFLLV